MLKKFKPLDILGLIVFATAAYLAFSIEEYFGTAIGLLIMARILHAAWDRE